MTLGYDHAVALPAMQSDGQGGQDELFKETNKVFDLGKGVIEMEVNKAGRCVPLRVLLGLGLHLLLKHGLQTQRDRPVMFPKLSPNACESPRLCR